MTVLKAPPVGTLLLDMTFRDMGYYNKVMVYEIDLDLQSAHNLFDAEYVTMLPIDDELSSEDMSYQSVRLVPNSFEYNSLFVAGYLSTLGGFARFDTVPSCFFVKLFYDEEFKRTSFYEEHVVGKFDLEFGEHTIGLVNRCYPDW